MPENGLIVDGVAAGTMYLLDSSIAMIDNLVTNPEASSENRHLAIVEILAGLDVLAVKLDRKHLLAYPKDLGMISHAKLHGFEARETGCVLMTKTLKGR